MHTRFGFASKQMCCDAFLPNENDKSFQPTELIDFAALNIF